jgi:hypothetical protein
VANLFNTISVECTDYTGVWSILKGSLIRLHGHNVCRVLRAFYPTPADGVLDPVLGWLSSGGHRPAPGGANCDRPIPPMPWFCVPFGAGFIILEFIVPLAVLVLLGAAVWVAAAQIREESTLATTAAGAAKNTQDIAAITARLTAPAKKL